MYFLETIEGRKGEDLSSASLKYLLINSALLRDRFCRHLSPHLPPSHVPTFRDGIICQTEVQTEVQTAGREAGRIDLLVREEGGAVVGIENKFWANFTPGQPKKYVQSLRDYVDHEQTPHKLVVLAPKERNQEILAHLRDQQIDDETAMLLWEDILEDLEAVRRAEAAQASVVAAFLHEFVERQVSSARIQVTGRYLVGENVGLGNPFHYDVLERLKSVFPEPGRISKAKKWIGFYFSLYEEDAEPTGADAPNDSVKTWFGFYQNDKSRRVEVGIHLERGGKWYEPPRTSQAVRFEGIERYPEQTGAQWTGIPLEYEERTIPQWKEILEPLLSDLRKSFHQGR